MKKHPRKPGKGAATPADDPSGVIDWISPINYWISLGDKPPYWADELARLAAALLPESVKQRLNSCDLWAYFKEDYFPAIRELDNAIAAAAYLLNRSCETMTLKQEGYRYSQEDLKKLVPFNKAAKEITQEKRADRAVAKLAEFLEATEGSEKKTRYFEAWRKNGISGRDVFTFKELYANWKISKKKLLTAIKRQKPILPSQTRK